MTAAEAEAEAAAEAEADDAAGAGIAEYAFACKPFTVQCSD